MNTHISAKVRTGQGLSRAMTNIVIERFLLVLSVLFSLVGDQ